MKILCLLIVLVNLFTALYEFKYDIDFSSSARPSRDAPIAGQEQIQLVNESTKAKTDASPTPNTPDFQPESNINSSVPGKALP